MSYVTPKGQVVTEGLANVAHESLERVAEVDHDLRHRRHPLSDRLDFLSSDYRSEGYIQTKIRILISL